MGLQLNSRRKPYHRPEKRVRRLVLLHNLACFGVTRATAGYAASGPPFIRSCERISRGYRCEPQTKIARRLCAN